MTILVIGEQRHLAELRDKLGDKHELLLAGSEHDARRSLGRASVVFDFIIDEDPSQLQFYMDCKVPVFLNSIKSSLRSLLAISALPGVTFFGFNGLPTFVNRPLLEVSLMNERDRAHLEKIMSAMGCAFELAPDRPGMITARVVCMIVNEAFCTIEDGTASPADIDTAMKLGTNYPHGPVEWGKKIGLRNVCDVISSLFEEKRDSRYQLCELLREEANRE